LEEHDLSACDLWRELTEALEECIEELLKVPLHLLEIHHLIHFFGGLGAPFLQRLPGDTYIGWKPFEFLFLKYVYKA
jgi:hypothetical protein